MTRTSRALLSIPFQACALNLSTRGRAASAPPPRLRHACYGERMRLIHGGKSKAPPLTREEFDRVAKDVCDKRGIPMTGDVISFLRELAKRLGLGEEK